LFSRGIHPEIFAEGVWDKRVHTEIVAALERALNNESLYVRNSVVEILTGAVAQGVFLCFHGDSYLNIHRWRAGQDI